MGRGAAGDEHGTRLARRYHWHSPSVRDFACEPHTAIVGRHEGEIMNLVDRGAKPAQMAMLATVREHPDKTLAELCRFVGPRHHDVRVRDVDLKRLGAVLAVAYERHLHNFAELLLLEKLGPRTLQSLALISEVVHGAPTRFSDPARFSFALGGKDGHPFPVPLNTYDDSLRVLRASLEKAKLGEPDKLDGLRRLDRFVGVVERRFSPEADFDALLKHEHAISPSLHGRTVFTTRQQSLF